MKTPDDLDIEVRPALLAMPETPELSEAWRSLFSAAWDVYETVMERRRARTAATAAGNGTNNTTVGAEIGNSGLCDGYSGSTD